MLSFSFSVDSSESADLKCVHAFLYRPRRNMGKNARYVLYSCSKLLSCSTQGSLTWIPHIISYVRRFTHIFILLPPDLCSALHCVPLVSRDTDAFQEDGGLSDLQ